jgi:hypothetical protein
MSVITGEDSTLETKEASLLWLGGFDLIEFTKVAPLLLEL